MQPSTLARTEHETAAGAASIVARLRSIKVFKAPRGIATLILVTAAYWFFAATVSQEFTFLLVGNLHRSLPMQIIFLGLAVPGVFVVFNEPADALLTSPRPILRAAGSALLAVLTLTTAAYWLNPAFSALMLAVAEEEPIHHPAFIIGNIILMSANIILPMLGGAFLARLVSRLWQRSVTR